MAEFPDPRTLIPTDSHDNPLSMKPLLAVAITEALAWALVSSIDPDLPVPLGHPDWEKHRAAWVLDPHLIPDEAWATIDWKALAQNLSCRLLGTGGWSTGGIYHGNASPQQTFDALVRRPCEDPLGELKMIFGVVEDDPEEATDD